MSLLVPTFLLLLLLSYSVCPQLTRHLRVRVHTLAYNSPSGAGTRQYTSCSTRSRNKTLRPTNVSTNEWAATC